MANERNNWENKPSTATPINAENLNKLEANAKKGADFADTASTIGNIILTSPDGLSVRTAIGAASSTHSHDAVTTTTSGFMSNTDKAKLDGITAQATKNDTDANLKNRANHTGTQAISTITGVVPIAQIPTGSTSTTVAFGNHTHSVATTALQGFMSAEDKTKLDGITAGATNLKIGTTATDAKAGNWMPPNASYNAYGMVKIGDETPQTAAMNVVTLTEGRTYAVQFDQQGHAVVNVPWVASAPLATTSTAGIMKKALGVEDSDAQPEDFLTLRNSFNELLANLRAAGIMQ